MSESAKSAIPVAVAVVKHDGRYLVGTREPDTDLAGKSEFPGGKIETGETPQEAAVRECLEETGLEVQILGNYPEVTFEYDYGLVHLFFFSCSLVSSQRTPLRPFRWIDSAELEKLDFPKANDPILEILLSDKSSQLFRTNLS